MGQRVSVMANQLNPFTPREAEPQNQENGRVQRNRLTHNNADPVDNGSGSPISERFFGTHFLMGGMRFDLTKPDTFLFGNNADIDLLGEPVKFPYGGSSETVSVLNALINIRRDSIRIIKEEIESSTGEKSNVYKIEFIYDCDVDSYIQLHYCAREIIDGENIKFDMRFPELKPSKKFACNAGADQIFNEVLFKPHQFDPQKFHYNGGFWFPVILEMTTQDQNSGFRDQSQITLGVVERSSQSLILKPIKQKLIMDGVVYLLQDVFGIENREANNERDFECSICKDYLSNTILLPCRHLCVCNNCVDSFLHNVKECPFCRSPVKALLTLDAVRLADTDSNASRVGPFATEHLNLIEALNGPVVKSETGTLSRASSMSINSRRSAARNALSRQEIVNEFSQQHRSSIENSSDTIELHDIVIQSEA